jgi:diguanylate cyclase (GGDEF)-like protein
VAAHRQIIRNSDPVLDFGDTVRTMIPRPLSCLSIPLTARGDLVGVMSLYSTHRQAFTDDHERIVEVVSGQLSTILKTAAEFDRTKIKALRDQLTGLPNIEHLRQLTRSYGSHDAPVGPFSVLLLDVDNLSQINEIYGQLIGDQILARLVRATRKSLRGADFLFRLRDDEFLVLLLQTDSDTSANIVRRVTETLQRESASSKPHFNVTISSASAPADAGSIDELIELATRRLPKLPLQGSRGFGADSIH